MATLDVITSNPDDFQPLLAWLSRDPAAASIKLDEMRRRLVWFFRRQGQSRDAEDLAHDVLLTMAKKCSSATHASYEAPEQLMVGIAKNLLRRRPSQPDLEPEDAANYPPVMFARPERADSDEARCLDLALAELTEAQRALFTEYFASDEWERPVLAKQLGLGVSALRVRVHRIKVALLKQIVECVESRAGRG